MMAMNKKEQAEMAALRRQVLVAGAFVRTERVLPDVAPTEKSGMVFGFAYAGTYRGVMPAWSTITVHGYGTKEEALSKFRSGSQNAKRLHSTKLNALRAHRWDVEQECANKLADIDEQISAELAGEAM